MAAAEVRVSGVPALVLGLVALGVEVEHPTAALRDIARKGLELVQANTPRRTGRLEASEQTQVTSVMATVSAGGGAVAYAGVINYGWPAHNINPAGFMQSADPVWDPYAVGRLEQDINAKITEKGLR